MDYTVLTDEKLVELAKKDEYASDCLINRYKIAVEKIARQYFLVGGDIDDLKQEGLIGVLKAVLTYDGSSSFSNYANVCIRNNIFSAIRQSNSKRNKPLYNFIPLSGIEALPDGALQDPVAKLINKESGQEVEQGLKKALSKLEFDVLTLFLENLSYEDIAEKLNKTVKQIDNALQRARTKAIPIIKGEGK